MALTKTWHRLRNLPLFWPTTAACFLLLAVRGWDRLTHAELFAEGGYFVGDALNHGWASVFYLYDGYFDVAPRLVAVVVATVVPVAHLPLATNIACYAITAAAAAGFVRTSYRWLTPSDGARVLLALLVCLAPGLFENLGNLANLHWALLYYLGLLALKDPKQPFKVWELAIAALIVVSTGAAVIFLPVASLRVLISWKKSSVPPQPKARFNNRLLRELGFFTILFAIVAYLLLQPHTGASNDGLPAVTHHWDQFTFRVKGMYTAFYGLLPFIGTSSTTFLLWRINNDWLFTLVAIVTLVLLWRLQRRMDYRFYLIPLWLLGLTIMFPMMLAILRYWAFYGIFTPPYKDWWFRYNFIFAATGLLYWFILLRPRRLFRISQFRSAAAVVLAIGFLSQAYHIFPITRYGKTAYWARTASALDSAMHTGCPTVVDVKTYPTSVQWRFYYHAAHPAATCSKR